MKHILTLVTLASFFVLSCQEESKTSAPVPEAKKSDPDYIAPKVLFNFDAPLKAKEMKVDAGSAEVVTSASGNQVLRVSAEPGKAAYIRFYPKKKQWDLSDYVNINLDVYNPTAREAHFRFFIKDPGIKSESYYRPNLCHFGWVKPEETRDFPALMVRHRWRNKDLPKYIDRFPKMTGIPHGQMLAWFGVVTSQVNELIFQLPPQPYAQTVEIDNIRAARRAGPQILSTPQADDFFPFIDQYGQYMHQDWPGKVHSDEDLLKQKEEEEKDLAQNPRPKTFNQYGGWKEGPTHDATGHFYPKKVDGKWWLIDPTGKLFWSMGCTTVGYNPMTVSLIDKHHFYKYLPDPKHPEYGSSIDYKKKEYDAGNLVLHKKYGENYVEKYNHRSLERARSWGLNTLGGWSKAYVDQPEDLKMPYTVVVWTHNRKPLKPFTKIGDPYSDAFEKAYVKALRSKSEMLNDPYCIGFFSNNEIHWEDDPAQVIRDIHAQNDASMPTVIELNKHLQEHNTTMENASEEVLVGFFEKLVDTYYRRFHEILEREAPNKLDLGSRIYDASLCKEVASASARYCDVVSLNIYEKDIYTFNIKEERNKPFFTEDKPFIIGEFDFGALDRGKFFTGIGYSADQRNRAEMTQYFLKSALENDRCVGAHWFNYHDSSTGSRGQDSENANAGILSTSDTPYTELIGAFREMGGMLYEYRAE